MGVESCSCGPATMDTPTDAVTVCQESCVGLGDLWATLWTSNCSSAKQSSHLPWVARPAAINTAILPPWLVVIRGLEWKHLRERLIVHMLKYTYAARIKRNVESGGMAPNIHLGPKFRNVVSFMLRLLCSWGKIHRYVFLLVWISMGRWGEGYYGIWLL